MGGVRVLRQSLPAFLGLRLHLACTLHGLPVDVRVAGAKSYEREVLLGMLENDAELVAERPGQTVIGTHFGRDFERLPASGHLSLLLPVRKSEDRRGGQELFKPLRHVVESVNWPWKGQFDLEEHVAVQTGTSSSGYWSAFSH